MLMLLVSSQHQLQRTLQFSLPLPIEPTPGQNQDMSILDRDAQSISATLFSLLNRFECEFTGMDSSLSANAEIRVATFTVWL